MIRRHPFCFLMNRKIVHKIIFRAFQHESEFHFSDSHHAEKYFPNLVNPNQFFFFSIFNHSRSSDWFEPNETRLVQNKSEYGNYNLISVNLTRIRSHLVLAYERPRGCRGPIEGPLSTMVLWKPSYITATWYEEFNGFPGSNKEEINLISS